MKNTLKLEEVSKVCETFLQTSVKLMVQLESSTKGSCSFNVKLHFQRSCYDPFSWRCVYSKIGVGMFSMCKYRSPFGCSLQSQLRV